jgi:hypothetical protein
MTPERTKQALTAAVGNVANFSVATQAEAEAGIASDRYMTPERTKQAIAALAATSGSSGPMRMWEYYSPTAEDATHRLGTGWINGGSTGLALLAGFGASQTEGFIPGFQFSSGSTQLTNLTLVLPPDYAGGTVKLEVPWAHAGAPGGCSGATYNFSVKAGRFPETSASLANGVSGATFDPAVPITMTTESPSVPAKPYTTSVTFTPTGWTANTQVLLQFQRTNPDGVGCTLVFRGVNVGLRRNLTDN